MGPLFWIILYTIAGLLTAAWFDADLVYVAQQAEAEGDQKALSLIARRRMLLFGTALLWPVYLLYRAYWMVAGACSWVAGKFGRKRQ